jgi:Coenzyme PQQ synthesis protein D (PqqD)
MNTVFVGGEMLDAVPVRNEAVRSETAAGELVLRVPLEPRWYLCPPVTWLLPVRRERAVALDRLGEEVWRACDGERTVEQIVEAFAARHHLRFHEARLSVMRFLQDLTRRGLVVMVVPRT